MHTAHVHAYNVHACNTSKHACRQQGRCSCAHVDVFQILWYRALPVCILPLQLPPLPSHLSLELSFLIGKLIERDVDRRPAAHEAKL